jgi:hypothetical protein
MTDAPKFHTGGTVPLTTLTTSAVPSSGPEVKVSRQERILYGESAPLVRKLGDAAQSLDDGIVLAKAALDRAGMDEAERIAGDRLKAIVSHADGVRGLFRRTAEQLARDLQSG